MNIFLLLAILLANAIALLLVYQFIKKLEKRDIVIFMAVSVASIYIGVSIIYWISGFGIDDRINEAARNFMTFLFVPINIILLIPFVASKYTKYKNGKINKRDFAERVIKVVVVAIIILALECIYFKHMKKNIKTLNNNIEQTMQQDDSKKANIIEDVITNTIEEDMTNVIENSVATNIIEDSISNQIVERGNTTLNQRTSVNEY